jgi:ABC-type transporter Mla maintaining outer membrane lipid asymmetry ATPase subunit MlaF
MKDRPPIASNVPAIEMTDVAVGSMRDQSLVVLRGIRWTVAPGECWVVAGLQGSGKTDFLMMTGGLMAPAAGTYRLFGEPMPIFDEARLPLRLRLGLVFETGQLFNHLTVWENIALPLRYHQNLSKAEAAEAVQAILQTLELEPWADSTPGAIGRNWQKRVGLARALTLQPEVLLVDSPLTGLDLRHVHWWLGFLDELSKGHPLLENRPMTLVVSTADLRPWKNRACHFAVLREGGFDIVGDWDRLEAARAELVHELLMAELRAG